MTKIPIHTNNHNKGANGRSREIEGYIEKTVDHGLSKFRQASMIDLGCDYGYGAHYACVKGYADPARTVGVELYGSPVPEIPVNILRESLEDPLLAQKVRAQTGIKHFDMGLLNHVLEHLMRPYDFMSAATQLFRPGSVLMIAVPKAGHDWAYWEGHYTIWDERILLKFMEHFGWTPLRQPANMCFRADHVELWAPFIKAQYEDHHPV